MEISTKTLLRIGDCRVDLKSGQIIRNGETYRVEVRTLRLLVCLAERAGEVVSPDELLKHVWPDVFVSQDSLYQGIATLRRIFGDDPKQPKYIETVSRLGYKMVAEVSPWNEDEVGAARQHEKNGNVLKAGLAWAIGTIVVLLLVVALVMRGKTRNVHAPKSHAVDVSGDTSIAVLPFLDLTEGMKEEEFADGLTEELIDRLSKTPGFHVPPPTSSFHYKNEHVSVAEVAKALGVTYVLDGSTRRSGDKLRVAARLVRTDNAYVVWSEAYDRPWGEMLKTQDEIAGEIINAARESMRSNH
jgi:transcriptional activator of cad operon